MTSRPGRTRGARTRGSGSTGPTDLNASALAADDQQAASSSSTVPASSSGPTPSSSKADAGSLSLSTSADLAVTDPRLTGYRPEHDVPNPMPTSYPEPQRGHPVAMPPPSYHIPDSPYQQSQASPRSALPHSPVTAKSRKRAATSSSIAVTAADGDEYEEDDWQEEDGSQAGGGGEDPENLSPRLLKQSRRAVQNRMAQRAFRERKEHYMKELQQRSEELDKLSQAMAQSEDRRQEIDTKAKALAERAMALDVQEQAMLVREAGEGLSKSDVEPLTEVPSSIPLEQQEEWRTIQVELIRLRRQLAERDVVTAALRRALEEITMVNGQLKARQAQIRAPPFPVKST